MDLREDLKIFKAVLSPALLFLLHRYSDNRII